MPGAVAKTKKATNILRPAIDVTFDKDAESEVFSDSRRFFYVFFKEKVTLYGEVAIKSIAGPGINPRHVDALLVKN